MNAEAAKKAMLAVAGTPGYTTVTTLPDGTNIVILLAPTVAGGQSGKFGRGVNQDLTQAYIEAIAGLSA